MSRLADLACGDEPYALVVEGLGDNRLPDDFDERFEFYLPNWRRYVYRDGRRGDSCLSRLRLRHAGQHRVPVIVMDPAIRVETSLSPLLWGNPTYGLNPRTNYLEAYFWHRLLEAHAGPRAERQAARERLARYVKDKDLQSYGKCYVFGTGPSLAKAATRSWHDGVRVVCNTIVRDRDLWKTLDPHFIVAADAHYHYSFTAFAKAFRADLHRRLTETDARFVYPEFFHPLVWREFRDVEDRLIPVPWGKHEEIDAGLLNLFEFSRFQNVLPLMLVVAFTVSDSVCLWGFDGRAPTDQLFWSNSPRHSYPELFESLTRAYPAFFQQHVPKESPDKYVKECFGNELEQSLVRAESRGKRIVMMHHSWTPMLQRRTANGTGGH